MARWSAPAKAILFGEHAVVYGSPALAISLDMRMTVAAYPGERSTVNGRPMTDRHHGYIKKALESTCDGRPMRVSTHSDIPSAAGMGSSAAITVASVAAGLDLGAGFDRDVCASIAHRVESLEERRPASPLDTSICTFGGCIMVSSRPLEGIAAADGEEESWEMPGLVHEPDAPTHADGQVSDEAGGEEPSSGGVDRWYIRSFSVPEISFVLGHTGLKGKTRAQVQKVRHFTTRQKGFAKDIIQEIGELTLEGFDALRSGDKEKLGRLMDQNDRLLGILGVSSPELGTLVDAARRHSYGAKMMGAGGGGCMMALTDEPDDVADAIRRAGGNPFIVNLTHDGVRKEEERRRG